MKKLYSEMIIEVHILVDDLNPGFEDALFERYGPMDTGSGPNGRDIFIDFKTAIEASAGLEQIVLTSKTFGVKILKAQVRRVDLSVFN